MATTASVSTPLSHSTPRTASPWSIFGTPLCWLTVIIVALISLVVGAAGWVRQTWRLLRLLSVKPELNDAQFNALADLVALHLQQDSRRGWLEVESTLDSIYDCLLTADECAVLRRCAEAGVPFRLIDRLAPRYAITSVYPRPAS